MDADELKRRFGKRVQGLREAQGLTQEQLAAQIGRSVDTVSNIERGINATRIEVAYHIALKLDVNSEAKKTKYRASVALLVGLVEECDDATLRSLTDLVRAGLTLHRRPG